MKNIKNNIWAVGAVGLVIGIIISACVNYTSDRDGYWGKKGGFEYGYGMYEHMGDGMMGGYYGESEENYDRVFLRGMIMHHEGAIIMSKKLLETTKRPELTKLGNDIIDAQAKEIEMMKGWEVEWFK